MANKSGQEMLASRDRRTTDAEELARINRHADSLNAEALDVLEYLAGKPPCASRRGRK